MENVEKKYLIYSYETVGGEFGFVLRDPAGKMVRGFRADEGVGTYMVSAKAIFYCCKKVRQGYNIVERGYYNDYIRPYIDATVKAKEQKFWYAVMRDSDDTDWGYGSDDLAKAQEMVKAYPDGYIAVIDESGSEPMCVDEIH